MAIMDKNRQVEKRVSESTLNRMRLFTGASVQQVRDAVFEVMVKGHVYQIAVDKQGKAKVVGKST